MNQMTAIRDGLIRRTGHHYYVDKAQVLDERVRERMRHAAFESLDAYRAVLADPEKGEAEWRALEDAITIGETYFFRYAEQFEQLRRQILPALIEARAERKALRIWSVGCSNGAEPYTVAIVLREVLGTDADAWSLSITGGDISEAALAKAQAGVYGPWALRALSEAMVERYFDRTGLRTWRLKRPYRSMVRFERENVLDLLSPAPPLHWSNFDVILCRNVLIYFAPDVALRLVAALEERLAPDGRLILGHAEAGLTAPLPEIPLTSEFRSTLDPAGSAAAASVAAVLPVTPTTALDWPTWPPALAGTSAQAAGEAGDLALLRRLADEGDYRSAREVCERMIARPDVPPTAFYLKAILCLVEDDTPGAETALKQAIYLDRNFVLAHHRLGVLGIGGGRIDAGRRSLRTALRLAARMNPGLELEGGDGITAGEFMELAGAQLRAEPPG